MKAEIGAALRVLRHVRQVSGHEMARRLGVSRNRVYQHENGNPTGASIAAYLAALSASWLEFAMVLESRCDVVLVTTKDPLEMMPGTLRYFGGLELHDDDGDLAGTYTSLLAMLYEIEDAGYHVWLKLEKNLDI